MELDDLFKQSLAVHESSAVVSYYPKTIGIQWTAGGYKTAIGGNQRVFTGNHLRLVTTNTWLVTTAQSAIVKDNRWSPSKNFWSLRAQIVNSVLLPRWTYKSLFFWDVCWGNRLEAAFEDYVLAAPRVEKYMHHRIYTDTTHRGLGLHNASWVGMCALIQLVQKALHLPGHKMPT